MDASLVENNEKMQSDNLIAEHNMDELKTSQICSFSVIGFMLLFVGWAFFFELDVTSHSMGEVIAATHTKTVQHLEGGIIKKILIREGQRVAKSQPLIEFEPALSNSDLGVIENRIAVLKIKKLRITAQVNGEKSFPDPEKLHLNYTEQIAIAGQVLGSYSDRFASSIETQQFKIAQKEAELSELRVRKKHISHKLDLLKQQLQINKKLRADGLTNEYEYLDLLKEESTLAGTIAEIGASIPRIESGIAREKSTLVLFRKSEHEKLLVELEDTRKQLTEFQEQRRKLLDRQERLLVLSPIDGTVLHLNVITEGAVVSPGGTLLSLVPSDDPLLIEVQLPVGDIGLTKIGQKARLQLLSGTARGYLPINGTVVSISADRILDQQGNSFYKVTLKPDALTFKRGSRTIPLVPGVRIQASLFMEKRTVAAYLIEPFKSSTLGALSEP